MRRILLLVLLLSSSYVFAEPIKCSKNQCVAVVNAGNAGSRLHVYSYELDSSNTPYKIKKIFSNKVDSGVASCQLNQHAINEYLSSLFTNEANTTIPVYFYATSGMRKQSFAIQRAYYNKLNHWFSKQANWQLAEMKTLTSKEEALYGWLAVNYELGTLSSPTESLVGVIDSGSASVQVAFPVTNTQHINPKDYTHLNIYGRDVTLFTHGFLGLGQDEIRTQYLDQGACFPTHYPLPNESSAQGNLYACEKFMPPLINDIHQVQYTVQSVSQDNPNQTWYLIGGISTMLQEKPFTFEHGKFTSQELAEKANRQVCQQDWSVLGTLYPENRHMYTSCLNASYFYSLLVNGLRVNKNQPVHYLSNKVSTNDWTLGVVLWKNTS